MAKLLENRFYYLDNFRIVLNWITERYSDLLTHEEQMFVHHFQLLPQAPSALLVRMVMRKGNLFRSGKLRYDEIGAIDAAVAPLIALGWVDDAPLLSIESMFGLLKKSEVSDIFGSSLLINRAATKTEQLRVLSSSITEEQRFSSWFPESVERVYQLRVNAICEHVKLLFFGNLHQDWTEFVLADLGMFNYEKVAFTSSSRGFQRRQDIDDYLYLFQCSTRFWNGESAAAVLIDIPINSYDNSLLERRRTKLLFQIGQYYEKNKEFSLAVDVYSLSNYPGSRLRAIRSMERCGQFESAITLANNAVSHPESEAESQQLCRILPRLRRHLGRPNIPLPEKTSHARIDFSLVRSDEQFSVEELARQQLENNAQEFPICRYGDSPSRVFYVENSLINSLLGLLCWSAVFSPIPNAFFHPFQKGPVDLYAPDFYHRRELQFGDCLRQLDSAQYIQTIRLCFQEKRGIQSPFIIWHLLTEELLDLALLCISAAHLKKYFERILSDIKSNRTGMPDLVQFWPDQKTYRMIEVKGPGDRLQDNQLRWLDYCVTHHMPVVVCYVQWTTS